MSLLTTLATILISFVAVETAQQLCSVLKDVNGCTVPFGLDIPFKDTFTPACLNHDVCYRCGVTYSWPQKVCDDAFKRIMYEKCDEKFVDSSNNSRKKRFFGSLKDKYQRLKEKYQNLKVFKAKLKAGWKEATKDISSLDELERISRGVKDIIFMAAKFIYHDDEDKLEKCRLAADTFHASVNVFGVYRYRYKNEPYCQENCARHFGYPDKD